VKTPTKISDFAKPLGFLAALTLAALLGGCFQAENPFYRDSDVITDRRFEGRFVGKADTNSTASTFVVVKPAKNRHYTITYHENDKWVELDAVLFKCGTNLFVDMRRTADNGAHRQPAVGPSGVEVLQLATIYGSHAVVRVQFVTDGIQQSSAYGNPVAFALMKHPNLKLKATTKGEPIEVGMAILTNPTEDLHQLLLEEGSNEDVFGFKAKWVKSQK
jgi:hypothetical protein